MSAPVWAITPAASAEQAATITFTKPAGLVDGDVLVVALRSQGTRNGELVMPAGWARGGSGTIPNDRVQGLFFKPIPSVAAESATSYAFGGLSTSTSRVIAGLGVLRGADLTHLNDGGIAFDTDATLPATTAGGVPYTVIALWDGEFTAGVSVVASAIPAGFANILTAQTAGGASPAAVVANSNTTGSRTGMVLASRAFESGSTAVSSLVTTWPAAPTDPKSAVWIVRGKVTTPARRGFDSVAEMRAKPGATWAHRGGSASYTEHSLAAYAAAAARGYGVLELSLQRTSDGVWFGCHDIDLARVTGNPALTQDVRTMTWAQVNAYQMTIGSQAPQPFMRWQDFIAAGYGTTHVLVLDPKNSVGSYQAEFLAMVAADVDPARVIMKWAGGLTTFADAASAAGFKTAGFWYQADYDANKLATETTHWDYLGMDLTAGTAWTGPGNIVELAAVQGKKVWGHIAATQADYNTARAKGADFVQSSGVAVIDPVSWWTYFGRGASTLPALTQSAVGAVTKPGVTGTATSVLPALTQAASGAVTPPAFTGAIASTLPPLTSAAVGTVRPPAVTGRVETTLPALTSSAVGTVRPPTQTGAIVSILPALQAIAVGFVTAPAFHATIQSTLPALTAIATGTVVNPTGRVGAIVSILPALTSAAVGTTTPPQPGEQPVIQDARERLPDPFGRALDAEGELTDYWPISHWE